MAIILVEQTNNQNLAEYRVGRANSTCEFPGIRQCFAIAGRRQSFMICTHVSPGATEQDISDTFGHMKNLGGNWVTSWHIIGPFVDHFNTASARWKSAQDIRNTFTAEFGDSGADHWILDISSQRHKRVDCANEGYSDQFRYQNTGSVNVKAELDTAGNKIRFYYKADRGLANWTRLYNKSFSRF